MRSGLLRHGGGFSQIKGVIQERVGSINTYMLLVVVGDYLKRILRVMRVIMEETCSVN